MKTVFLEHKNIDKKIWDNTIDKAYNGIIYAYSWYLDIVSPQWNAVITEDYNTLMPLPAKKKYGIDYIIQPMFMQQGGVFSTQIINENNLREFINEIPEKYKYIVLNFNVFINDKNALFKHNGITMHLDLVKAYENIYEGYNSNTKRNIKESEKHELKFHKNIDADTLIKLFRKSKAKDLKQIKDFHFDILQKLINESKSRNMGNIYGVSDKNDKILAAAFLTYSNNKHINIFNASSKEGYDKKAMFFLFDRYFSANSGKVITFDFEGSSIPGIARFYKGFGAKTVNFPILRSNKLPLFIRIFKK